jgi:hypothetical protein
MIVSRCCKDFVNVQMDHFVCENCGRPCDTVCAVGLGYKENVGHDDERNFFEG